MGRARALAVGLAVLAAGLGGTLLLGDDDGSTAGAPATATAAAPAAPPTAPPTALRALGDRTVSGQVQFVVHRVVDPFVGRDTVVTARAGWRWIATEVEVTNLSRESVALLSERQFVVRDVTSRRFGLAETVEDLPRLDGALATGASRRAVLVFEVPQGVGDLRLTFDRSSAGAEPIHVALG